MLYNCLKFTSGKLHYNLIFQNRITLLGGDSASGKTVLCNKLKELSCREEYKNIVVLNYGVQDLLSELKKQEDKFMVIDNFETMVDDEVRRFINFNTDNQYLLVTRNCDGLCVNNDSFKEILVDNDTVALIDEV